MLDIKQRENKIKERRKQTPRREFVKEIASWYGFVFRKHNQNVTTYSDKVDFPLYPTAEYEKIRMNFIQSGRAYNSASSLFDQIKDLRKEIGVLSPHLAWSTENALYSDAIWDAKNVYLSYQSWGDSSNILYSFYVKINSHNVVNSVMVRDNSEIIFQSAWIIKSYKVFYSKYIVSSDNVWFSDNLISCSECLFCDNLTNQKFCIYNKQLSQTDYLQEKNRILSQKQFFQVWNQKISHSGHNVWSSDVEGSFVVNAQSVTSAIKAYQVKNGHNIIFFGWAEPDTNIVDCCVWWSPITTDNYGCFGTGGGSNVYMSAYSYRSSNQYYCMFCESCNYCLWCIGLKNQKFCILNKQYTKEERFELANKIFEQMDKDWTLWQFFPGSMNPFYFNDTIAYLIDDTFTKEEVTKEWYLRRDEEIKVDVPVWAEVIGTEDFGTYQWFEPTKDGSGTQWEWKIDPEILKKVIKDDKGNYYKIVPMELEFLQKHGLPLPEIHWLERIKLWFKFK